MVKVGMMETYLLLMILKGLVVHTDKVLILLKKQNQVISGTGVAFETFEGWDWLVSGSYAKSLVKQNAEVLVLTE